MFVAVVANLKNAAGIITVSVSSADRKVSLALQDVADALSESLEEIAGQRMKFSLVVFQTKPGSRLNYVSNCKREDVIMAMKTLINGWEQGIPDIEAHKYD